LRYHKHLFESASEALISIFYEDRYADKAIESFFRKNRKWGKRDRQFFAELVYDCVRWWRLYWFLLDEEEKASDVFFLLAVSLFNRGMEKPDFDEYKGLSWERLASRKTRVQDPAIEESIPDWLQDYGRRQLGESWPETISGLNRVNQIVLRTNTLISDRDNLLKALDKESFCVRVLPKSPQGVILNQRGNVFGSKAFKDGMFEVQDGSSQKVAYCLDPQPGEIVVDACAGAGGKTLHIGSLMENKGRIIALDIYGWKLDQLKLRARRNKIFNIERRVVESNKTIKRLHGKADRLLLDVPCSGLGVLRRNPDTKWKMTPEKISELKELQQKLLQEYSKIVKPGGTLVYSTCSIMPEENQDQVDRFLEGNSGWEQDFAESVLPIEPGYDGFFLARLRHQTS